MVDPQASQFWRFAVKSGLLDDAKLRAMGYAPRTTFDEGLAQTVQWYRDNQEWWRALKAKAALAK